MTGNYAKYNLAAEPEFFRYIYEADIGYKFSKKVSVDAGIFHPILVVNPPLQKTTGILAVAYWQKTHLIMKQE